MQKADDADTDPDAPTRKAEGANAEALAPTAASRLRFSGVLGEGGMGIVRAAVQSSLERSVAVKSLKANASNEDAHSMLREAWVTGFLEHPSIVPIHDIDVAPDGTPLVVMRRIHGTTWHDCLRDPKWAQSAGARDLLEQNLRVLLHVCHAVVFAHEKGVMHRDLKPANVMLGSFGEVYVLDWGIALALSGEPAMHLPLAQNTRELVGTIPYMAPEMAGTLDMPLCAQTDVYLLGAVLFEIATGSPPHPDSLGKALAGIDASPPPIPQGVPQGLAAIIEKAMQRDPSQRHVTVAELRSDVQTFLTHRDSLHVATEATKLLDELRNAMATGQPRRRLFDLWGECRFAFREALRTWPNNVAARDGHRDAAVLMAEHELPRDPSVAAAMLVDVEDVPPDVRRRVEQAVSRSERERAGNAQIASDLDPNVGGRRRTGVLAILGIIWTASAIAGEHIGPHTHLRFAIGTLMPIPFIAFAWAFSKELRRTALNRRMMSTLVCLLVVQATLFWMCGTLGIGIEVALAIRLFTSFIFAAMATITFDKRFWPMTVGLAIASVFATEHLEWRGFAAALGYLGVTINILVVWWQLRAARSHTQ